MYATNGLSELFGMSADELIGRSFYYYIQENCLSEAVRCLESAKANDSIAYLRFWFRDPREDDPIDRDESTSEAASTDEDEGGVPLDDCMESDPMRHAVASDGSTSRARPTGSGPGVPAPRSSGSSTEPAAAEALFDQPVSARSSHTSATTSNEGRQPERIIELEAVVSCTSDGLVVVLREARPLILDSIRTPHRLQQPPHSNGIFASPWAPEPIMPNPPRDAFQHDHDYNYNSVPIAPRGYYAQPATLAGPSTQDFMSSIREVAVFAWALIGINGSLSQYSRGTPTADARPQDGAPIWVPEGEERIETEPTSEPVTHGADGRSHGEGRLSNVGQVRSHDDSTETEPLTPGDDDQNRQSTGPSSLPDGANGGGDGRAASGT
jgi:hypothetical protein